MEKFQIVTDSSSGITQAEALELGISVLPLSFTIDGKDYEEGVTIAREDFFDAQAAGAKISTSQPAPERLMDLWDQAISEGKQVLHIPISSSLSSSCQTAKVLAETPEYAGKVFVADNRAVSTPLRAAILDALELCRAGWEAEQVKDALEGAESTVFLAVDTLKYLHQGGRIPATTAVVGTMLNIKPVLKLQGPFSMADKCRGMKLARKAMLEHIGRELETTYKEAAAQGSIHLMAASSAGQEVTEDWVAQIREAFPGMDVLCDDLSLSICCHTGPNVLGIGCAVKPIPR